MNNVRSIFVIALLLALGCTFIMIGDFLLGVVVILSACFVAAGL